MKKYKVFYLGSFMTVAILLALTMVLTVPISRISIAVSGNIRKIPIYSVETDQKKIAVTFDAAWGAQDTEELLEILDKYNAKATVFCLGQWVKDNPEEVKMFYDNGHEIGNHSYSHPAFSKISREEIRKEITDCNEIIKEVTGEYPALLRAPSGDYDNKSIEACESMGMKMIQWDADSVDYKGISVNEIYERIIKNTENGSILLFHNGVENTPAALEKILEALKNDGYEFVTVSQLIYKENYTIDHTGRQHQTKM